MTYVLYTLFVIACMILILVVLLQPGKGDAASALGGGAGGAAFGPRGTTSLLAKVTIASAIAFMGIAFLFQIPGLIVGRSVTSGISVPEGTAETPAATDVPGAPLPTEGGAVQVPGATPDGAIPAGAIRVGEDGKIQSVPMPAPAGAQPVDPAKQPEPAKQADPAKQDSKQKDAPQPAAPTKKQ